MTLITQQLELLVNSSGQDLDPTLVVDCFNIFLSGVNVSKGRVAITQGLEQLTMASARCFFHTFCLLMVANPTLSALEGICQHYCRVFPHKIDFTSLPSHYSMVVIEALVRRDWSPYPLWRNNNRPPDHEYILFTQDIAMIAQAQYQQEQHVPNWIFNFAFNSLSLDPLPSSSVVANCLKIIAIRLGCDVWDMITLDDRYAFLGLDTIYFLTKV